MPLVIDFLRARWRNDMAVSAPLIADTQYNQ